MRKPLKEFANHCEQVLKKNDHKGGWATCSKAFLLAKLMEECGELAQVLETDHDGTVANKQFVYKEACDVANIAMMIADNWGISDVTD